MTTRLHNGWKLTNHFLQDRLFVRFKYIVKPADLGAVLDNPTLQVEPGKETWVLARTFDRVKYIHEPNSPEKVFGNELWVLIKRPNPNRRGDIVSLVLRGSWQGDKEGVICIREVK